MPPATVAISQAWEPRLWKGRTSQRSITRPYSALSNSVSGSASHSDKPHVMHSV